MFCIMTPVLAIPIIVTLGIGMRESKKPEKIEAAAQVALHRGKPSLRTRAIEIFWQLDFVGLVLLVVSLERLSLPAGGKLTNIFAGRCWSRPRYYHDRKLDRLPLE